MIDVWGLLTSSFAPIGHKLPDKNVSSQVKSSQEAPDIVIRPVRQHYRGQLSKYSFFLFSSISSMSNHLFHFHKFSPFPSIFPISTIHPTLSKNFQLTAHQRASTSQRTAAQIFLLLATSNSWQRSALMTTTMMVIMIADHDYHC